MQQPDTAEARNAMKWPWLLYTTVQLTVRYTVHGTGGLRRC